MAWEKRRNGRLYYYRSRRNADGRVVKEYLGCGPEAVAAAKEDAARKAERMALRQEEQQQRLADLTLGHQILNVYTDAGALLEAALLAAGFHRPGRKPWRKRRSRRTKDAKPKNENRTREAEEGDTGSGG